MSSPKSTNPSPSPLQTRLLTRFPALHRLHLLHPSLPIPSLVASFVVLHELTAVLPAGAIFLALRQSGSGERVVGGLASLERRVRGGVEEHGEGWVEGWLKEGEVMAEKIGRRYGVLGFEKKESKAKEQDLEDTLLSSTPVDPSVALDPAAVRLQGVRGQQFAGDVANAVGAYVIVKALLPLRIAGSLWLSPPFARAFVVPIGRLWSRAAGGLRRRPYL